MIKQVHAYPEIERWFHTWLTTPGRLREDYQVLAHELEDSEAYASDLELLESDLRLAADSCSDFRNLIQEKAKLPPGNDEANKVVLNKLAEVRAIVGLVKLGFSELSSLPAPGADLSGVWNGKKHLIEVTRLGSSEGKRAEVWDEHQALPDGGSLGLMSQHGSAPLAIGEAVYREVEEKSRQLRSAGPGLGIVWISLGRDYFIAGRYELNGVGVLKEMRRTMTNAVVGAVEDSKATGLFEHIGHVVLCLGRDKEDIVVPQMERAS